MKFVKAEAKVVMFNNEDVITTSFGGHKCFGSTTASNPNTTDKCTASNAFWSQKCAGNQNSEMHKSCSSSAWFIN